MNIYQPHLLALCLPMVLTLIGCQNRDEDSPRPAEVAGAGPTSWEVRADGIGLVRVGMSLTELGNALGEEVRAPYQDFVECDHVRPKKLPAGVALMVEADTIVRVEVDSSNVLTEEGVGVGDLESRVLELYQGRIQVEPHKYTGPEGHYLVVSPPGDTLHRIIFETDGGKVTTFRTGRRPAVEYVEGCA